MNNQSKAEQAERYIRRIRNHTKRFYADAVFACILNNAPLPPDPKNLSAMAAQAVRMQLRDLLA